MGRKVAAGRGWPSQVGVQRRKGGGKVQGEEGRENEWAGAGDSRWVCYVGSGYSEALNPWSVLGRRMEGKGESGKEEAAGRICPWQVAMQGG